MSNETLVWELVELDAVAEIFLDREGFRAEQAGMLILPSHSPFAVSTTKSDRYVVYFGQGIAHWGFKTLDGAIKRVKEIIQTYNGKERLMPRVEIKYNVRGKERRTLEQTVWYSSGATRKQ